MKGGRVADIFTAVWVSELKGDCEFCKMEYDLLGIWSKLSRVDLSNQLKLIGV